MDGVLDELDGVLDELDGVLDGRDFFESQESIDIKKPIIPKVTIPVLIIFFNPEESSFFRLQRLFFIKNTNNAISTENADIAIANQRKPVKNPISKMRKRKITKIQLFSFLFFSFIALHFFSKPSRSASPEIA